MAIKITYERIDGKDRTFRVPRDIAWEVARALAKTHGPVKMAGRFASLWVLFDGSGGGAWGPASIEPGQQFKFDASTIVVID